MPTGIQHSIYMGLLLTLLISGSIAHAGTVFIVNSIGDNGNATAGDGTCWTGDFIGPENIAECTLRAAIEEANEVTGEAEIHFSSALLPVSGGISQISHGSALPEITNTVLIDGFTHPDHDPDSRIANVALRYNGDMGLTAHGLHFSGAGTAGSEVRGISIRNFTGDGIRAEGGDNYQFRNNVIGAVLTSAGVIRNGNDNGIVLNDASTSSGISVIRDNLILANDRHGIDLTAGTSTALVHSNIIGLQPPSDPADTFEPDDGAANGASGIRIALSAGPDNVIGASILGGEANVISNNPIGIIISGDEQFIYGNLLGLPADDPDDVQAPLEDFGNDTGVSIIGSNNIIGGSGAAANQIGNGEVGIHIHQFVSGSVTIIPEGNSISGNHIGVTEDGREAGFGTGIGIEAGSGSEILGNTIAHNDNGIFVGEDSSQTVIRGNEIINQGTAGIWSQANVIIGGSSSEDGNLIGNTAGYGVMLDNTSSLAAVRNNFIGISPEGDDLGNAHGIGVLGGTGIVEIGTGGGNIIGYNTNGLMLFGTPATVTVQSNLIGLDPSGLPVPNETGIRIGSGLIGAGSGYIIGFSVAGNLTPALIEASGNTIAYNSAHGINLSGHDDSASNTIRGNRIFANGAGGIFLGPDGSEVDIGGGESGPNNMQNFPELDTDNTEYDAEQDVLQYRFRVRTEDTNADYPLRVDFYLSDSSEAQGRTYIGTVDYEAGAAMTWVTGTLSPPDEVAVGGDLVATATDQDGNTSEFSPQPVFLGELPDDIFADRFEQD